jgi:hypothetical protein
MSLSDRVQGREVGPNGLTISDSTKIGIQINRSGHEPGLVEPLVVVEHGHHGFQNLRRDVLDFCDKLRPACSFEADNAAREPSGRT